VRFDHVLEAVKQVGAVVGASCGFGMVLNRKGRDIERSYTLNNLVVEAEVADFDTAEALGRLDHALARCINRKAVVLRRDFNVSGGLVHHWLVDSTVAVFELVGGKAQSSPEKLVSKTDAKERQPASKGAPQKPHLRVAGRRVAGAIRVEQRNGIDGLDIGYEITGEALTSGNIVFHCVWDPLSAGASVVAGAGGAL
jgi:hypothetical protein